MKQLLDRIGYSIIGLIVLLFLEGIVTLGGAFNFEAYNWIGYTVQGMFIYLAVWLANQAYDSENPKQKRPTTF
jgi:hypothetical protein